VVTKTYEEINQRIRDGDAVVVTAEELVEIVRERGVEKAAKEVDVVTTGTFGAMCSSGAFLNFGHADPPIKLGGGEIYLNDVPAYSGLAAVDTYIGATAISTKKGIEYGGGHVIEDLVRGKEIVLKGKGYGTDCYPRREIETTLTINDINQAILVSPRNIYQRYVAATNSKNETLYTYMGTLLPNYGNVNFSGAGVLSPLHKDPNYETIGIGTRIFIGGAQGYIIGQGTQHAPGKAMGTAMVLGDLKKMDPKYVRGCTIHRYGTSVYLGIGIPIPLINERVAKTAALGEDEIKTNLLDYGVARRDRPILREVTYKELRSGTIEISGKEVPVSPLSSFKDAREIAAKLKKLIEKGEFLLNTPAELLPRDTVFKPMKHVAAVPVIKEIMTKPVITGLPDEPISHAAKIFAEKNFDHLPIADKTGKLVGIVTSWDVAIALSTKKKKLSEIMTKKVITASENDPVDAVARKLEQHGISGVPVVDAKGLVSGIITSEDISKLIGRRTR